MTPWLVWTGALAATLVLAAWCTPRAWWRRPNLRALAVVAGGTLGFGLRGRHERRHADELRRRQRLEQGLGRLR